MGENKLLAELRAQRELIRKHLEWLDQQIGDRQTDARESAGHTEDDKKLTPDTPHSTEAPVVDIAQEIKLEEPGNKADDEAENWFSSYKAPSGDDILKAKIGCFVLFALGSLLFLFLLFGLPYLMN